MSPAVAVAPSAAPLLAFAGVGLVSLFGFWLLVSSAARRSVLTERGGGELRGLRLDQRLNARLVRTRRGANFAARLRSAGVELTATRFLTIVVGVGIAAYFIFGLVFPPPLAFVAGLLAVWSCFSWLSRRLEKRKEQFVEQLPEVARLLSNGASAGLSMPAAIELTVREIESPARDELQTVIDELALGRTLEDSLEGLQRRLPSREISVLLTTLVIQQRAGGDVVHALQELSGTLDQRRQTLREVSTLMAGAVYTSYVVPALGVGALLLLNTINSRTLHAMTTQPLGILVLVFAGVMYAIGWILIRRTTRIEL